MRQAQRDPQAERDKEIRQFSETVDSDAEEDHIYLGTFSPPLL